MGCKSEEEFHSALNEVNKRWPTLHNNAKHFLSYFVKGPADVIKDSMRADIRSMCGLGFPPTTYSQNGSECLNRYVKEMVVQYCKTYTGRADGETGFTDRTNGTVREDIYGS